MESEQEEARKNRSRSLSVPSPDLVGGPVVAALGRFTRRSCGARQRSDHGDIDQSREHVGSEFEPIQPGGLTCLPVTLHIEAVQHCSRPEGL